MRQACIPGKKWRARLSWLPAGIVAAGRIVAQRRRRGLPGAAVLGLALAGRPGAYQAARPAPRRQPAAEVLAEHPLEQLDVLLERWQQRLALFPAKRLPFLATALQENG